MKRKYKVHTRKKKRLNLFTTLLILLIISGSALFLSQQINERQITSSNATTTCTTPGGCGGDCNPNQNNGCGYGGCRYWEYCADENNDGIPSCYDTTNLGKILPDYTRACGTEKANKSSPGSTLPSQSPSTSVPTATPAPQNAICNNPNGCGGNCNPNQNSGCGYGGCRFWEYCADENNDGIPSCYDTTDLGRKDPDYSRACGTEKTSSTIPSPTQFVASPTSHITPTNLPGVTTTFPSATPTPVANNPSNTPIQPTSIPQSDGEFNMSKLCIPLEVHGSNADKLDIAIFPMGFTQEEAESSFYNMAYRALQTLKKTNLQEYPNESLDKMNWHIMNVYHPDFKTSFSKDQPIVGFSEIRRFSREANFCGQDIFMMITNEPSRNGGLASFGNGAIIYSGGILQDGGAAFAHEWGHAAANLRDEVPSTNNSHGLNCTNEPAAETLRQDPCPPNPPEAYQVAGAYYCKNSMDNPGYKKPCPQWDCNLIDCSPLARELLKDSGCYPRCGTVNSYRPAANSIMSNPWDSYNSLDFNGPSLVNIIEVIFAKYK